MKKKFNSLLSLVLALLMVMTSAICGMAVNDAETKEIETSNVVDTTEESTANEVTSGEMTTEEVIPEESTAPSEAETTTEKAEETTASEPSTEETVTEEPTTLPVTEPSTNPEETTAPNEETTTAPEGETTTNPAEDESTTEPEDEPENPVPEKVVLSSATSARYGITVKWEDALEFLPEDYKYSRGYYVYRKTADTSWKRVGDVSRTTEFLDKKAVYGETYTYTVKAYYYLADGTRIDGYYDKAGLTTTAKYVMTPVLGSFSFQSNKLRVSWSATYGATKYVLYRASAPDGSYKRVYEGTKRYYNDKKVAPGNTYYYKLRAYVGTKASAASEYKSYTYIVSKAKINEKLTVNASAIKLQWSKIEGADGYVIYRRTSASESWQRIKTVKSGDTLSYTNKNLNGAYYYLIRGYHTENGKNYYGEKSNVVRARTLDKVATIKASTNKNNLTTTIKWSKVKGASVYELYAKVSGGDWVLLVTTDSSTRTYSHFVSDNTNYYYRVRAIYNYTGEISVAPFSSYVKVTVNYLPSFTYSLPKKDISKPTYITMKIKNTGNKTMRIYAEGATLVRESDADYLDTETELKLSKNTSRGYVDFIDIPAGQTKTLYFYVSDNIFGYSPKDFVGFMFTYNNGVYVVAASEYYGSQTYFAGTNN